MIGLCKVKEVSGYVHMCGCCVFLCDLKGRWRYWFTV